MNADCSRMMITAMPKVDDRDDNKRDAKKSEDDIDYAEIPAEAKKRRRAKQDCQGKCQ